MDDAQRRELQMRKAALKQRQEETRREQWEESRRSHLAPLLSSLNEAGENYELWSSSDQAWLPRWIPYGYSKIPWQLAPYSEMIRHPYDRTPSPKVIAAVLPKLVAAEEEVTIVYVEPWIGVTLTCGAAVRHAGAAVEAIRYELDEMWIVHVPGDWILRAERDWTSVYTDDPALLGCCRVRRQATQPASG